MSENSGVALSNEYVSISDENGEIVRWCKAEWMKNPNLGRVIGDALRIFRMQGGPTLRSWIAKNSISIAA